MNRYQWNISKPVSEELVEQFPELSALQLTLLSARGIVTQRQIDEFFAPDYESDLHDPLLFPDMQKAVDRIFEAIEQGEKIVVYGDYDVDGMTGATVLLDVLELFHVSVEGFIPNRYKDGYGVTMGNVRRFVEEGVSLMITVDCGISNAQQIDGGNELGLTTIVTDHHYIPERVPKAYAIIHPLMPGSTYPYRWLTGVGVAYKLAIALLAEGKRRSMIDVPDGWEKWLLDLVALGTVADCGNLLGENRTLLLFGLRVLSKTRRLGIQKLLAMSGVEMSKVSGIDIGWKLAPRINAPSRVEDPMPSFRLLRADNENDAERFAFELDQYNEQRRVLTDSIRTAISLKYGETISQQKILIEVGTDWREGVLGLVAGRFMEKYQIPVVLLLRKDGGEITGSLRSPVRFNIIEHLTELRDLLLRFGGHAQAAGLTLHEDHLEEFERQLRQRAEVVLSAQGDKPTLEVASELRHDDITWENYDAVQQLAPFGSGNDEPLFLVRRLRVHTVSQVGKESDHLRLKLETLFGKLVGGIGFGLGDVAEHLAVGQLVDVVAWLDVNEWNGNRELQLRVKDLTITR